MRSTARSTALPSSTLHAARRMQLLRCCWANWSAPSRDCRRRGPGSPRLLHVAACAGLTGGEARHASAGLAASGLRLPDVGEHGRTLCVARRADTGGLAVLPALVRDGTARISQRSEARALTVDRHVLDRAAVLLVQVRVRAARAAEQVGARGR